MRSQIVVVCFIVLILAFVSAVLGFAAEATKIKISDITLILGICTSPSTPALPLALAAAVILIVAEIIVAAYTRCVCCKRAVGDTAKSNKTLALVCSIISWVTAVIGTILFFSGAGLQTQHDSDVSSDGLHYCRYIKPGVFAGASCLALLSTFLGVGAIVLMDSVDQNQNAAPPPPSYYDHQLQGGIAMGQPHMPPPTGYNKDVRGQLPQQSV